MKQLGLKKLISLPQPGTSLPSWRVQLLASLRSWELYVILLIAAILRLYHIDTTQFDGDQAKIFRMAYDAVHQGMLVATANGASLPLLNPPATIYFLMIPAAISADPLWAAVMTALLALAAIWLTYIMTQRYFSRPAATLAALLYATASYPVFYSRFIWNQNFLLFFVLLFILVLLQGTIERRKGWLAFALPLLGLLYQFHGSSSLLLTALAAALLLSPGTLRWHDLVFGLAGLLLIYTPYLLWEWHTQFHDILVLLDSSQQKSQIDNLALLSYQQFFTPSNSLFYSINTPFRLLTHLYIISGYLMTALVIVAGIAALLTSLLTRVITQEQHGNRLLQWWRALRADPARSGLLVFIMWQMGPLLLLTKHNINLYPHYLIILLPGTFIMLGVFLSGLAEWLCSLLSWKKTAVGTVYALALTLITIQLSSSVAVISSLPVSHFNPHDQFSTYYNDLHSLQTALQRADALARQKHIKHIYISADHVTEAALQYLAGQEQTATTVFNDSCLVLPGSDSGPALLLVGPYSPRIEALARQYASATLLEALPRLNGGPFKLYEVHALPQSTSANQAILPQHLQLRGAERFTAGQTTLAVTHWNILRSAPARDQNSYDYELKDLAHQDSIGSGDLRCTLTSLTAGDQLLAAFPLHDDMTLKIQTTFTHTSPLTAELLSPLPVSFETGAQQTSLPVILQSGDGKMSVDVTLS